MLGGTTTLSVSTTTSREKSVGLSIAKSTLLLQDVKKTADKMESIKSFFIEK